MAGATAESGAGQRLGRRAWWPTPLQVAAVLLCLMMALRMGYALSRGSRLTNESGIWSALAIDYAHGVVYRPIEGPLGIGGTRYFPLHVILQGEMIRHGVGPVPAGFAILVASAGLLLAGLFALMRALGVRAGLAWPVAVLWTGTGAGVFALTSIRGDLLPAALNVWGLACGVAACRARAPRAATTWAAVAGTLFAAAFFAKATTLFGVTATALTLALAGRRNWRAAAAVAVAFVAVAVPALAGVEHASHGQFWANFKACAAGGQGLSYMVRKLPMLLSQVAIADDPIGAILLSIGAAAALVAPRSAWTGLAGASLAVTAAATVILFVSPGIYVNHLLDLDLAVLVFAAVVMTALPSAERVASAGLAGLALVAVAHNYVGLLGDLPNRMADYRQVVRRATDPAAGTGPVLTDFELFSVLQGRSPFVLDDFMLGVLGHARPALLAGLYRELDRGDFSAVILKADPTGPTRRAVWGEPFVAHLQGAYRPAFTEHGFIVYWRQTAGPSTRAAGGDHR